MLRVEREGSCLTLRLDRPEVGNALNGELMERLAAGLVDAGRDDDIRVIVLTGTGTVFCAGGDLHYMRRMAAASQEDNRRDAERGGELFRAIDESPVPVVAAVNGPARGGGVGLVAACDVVVVSRAATFAFPEVRLGVVPALISPFVIHRIGASRARRLFLTGETFSAESAAEWGLVDRVVEPDEMAAAVAKVSTSLLRGAPGALAHVKHLVRQVAAAPADDVAAITAAAIAAARASEEAREGFAAFLEKRTPPWAPPRPPARDR